MANATQRPARTEVRDLHHSEAALGLSRASDDPAPVALGIGTAVCAPTRETGFSGGPAQTRLPDEPVGDADLEQIRDQVAAAGLTSEAERISAVMALYRARHEPDEEPRGSGAEPQASRISSGTQRHVRSSK